MPSLKPVSAVDSDRALRLLADGDLTLTGRLVESSNNAMVGTVRLGDDEARCVYKPIRGERPLWDFPDGALARREVAAFLVAAAAGITVAPPTVLRDGPFGIGMAQLWIDDADQTRAVDVFPADAVADGWLPVLRAEDDEGRPLIVAHLDSPELAAMAVFDTVANNADRKASHLLALADGTVYGVDHGLTFHTDDKLRTVLWGWSGRPIPADLVAAMERLAAALGSGLAGDLAAYLTTAEIDALASRTAAVLANPTFREPPGDRPAIPWPPL